MSGDDHDGDSPGERMTDGTGQRESIPIEALAERVYKMLLHEIRVERTRGHVPGRNSE